MRHSKSGRTLNRNPAHRKALFRNMSRALLVYGRLRTTEAKAMELRKYVEPLITLALRNDLHARREAYRYLCNHQLVKRLFDEIGPLFAGIAGGYTRVVKLGLPRKGDAAPMAVIEFTKSIVSEAVSSASAEKGEAAAKKVAPKKTAAKTAEADAKPKVARKPKAVEEK